MDKLESCQHLYQPTVYQLKNGWTSNFIKAVKDTKGILQWDVAALMACLSLNYPTGERTLIKGISRNPWMAELHEGGEYELAEIPPHRQKYETPGNIADNLMKRLCNEAEKVCKDKKEIYILQSGGLDSRIVAGILSKLLKDKRLDTKPVCVSWGIENSRDVHYSRATAEILGFEWKHINLDENVLLENIDPTVDVLGGYIPALHMHAMRWFENVSEDALVLAGSYGDSVGRAEFSGKHLIELKDIFPTNIFKLLTESAAKKAWQGISKDIENLKKRKPDASQFAHCEHQMQGFYMRGMISHIMNIINQHCAIYQMFTEPEVYQYMWSIHPAYRDDKVYACLLEKLSPELARLPWARTNKSLRGETRGAEKGLNKKFHKYPEWIRGKIIPEYEEYLEPSWYEQTGIFNPKKVSRLFKNVKLEKNHSNRFYDIFLILLQMRILEEKTQNMSRATSTEANFETVKLHVKIPSKKSSLRVKFSQNKFLYNTVKKLRRHVLRKKLLKKYPPEY